MKRLILLLALATSVFGIATSALARVESIPIRARMERPERLPEAGRAFTAVIRIEAAPTAELLDIDLTGDGWTVARFTAPRDLTLGAGEHLLYELTATPGSGFGPLVLSAKVDGRRWRQSFDLSVEAYGGLLPTDSDRLPSQRILPAGGDRMAAHLGYTLAELEAMAKAPEDPALIQAWDKDRSSCTLNGNIVYWHEDNHWAHAAGVIVHAYGEPAGGLPFGPFYGVATADDVGVFSLSVPRGVKVRLKFWARSSAVNVQKDNLWETDYQWWTTFYDIPQGASSYDIGPIYPNNYHGAMHISTVVTHSRNHFRDVGNAAGYHWNVQQIDVQWPEEDGSSYYDSYWEELHLGGDVTWLDWVITHEWGHYWHHQHAYFPGHSYCNGVCDGDPSTWPETCGHCQWCPEYEEVAWKEGIAQLISRLCSEYLVPRVVYSVRHVGLESPHNDPNCDWWSWRIENVVAGAIWDIANDSRGTDTYGLNTDLLGNPLYDQLALGTTEILRVMTVHCACEGHRPRNMPGYFRCMAERISNMGSPDATVAMLWETAMNWDLQTDEQPPPQVPNLTSTLPANTPTPQAIGGFYWNAPTDNMSGTVGYSIALVQGSGPAMPDHVIDTVNQQIWTNELGGHLAPGTYYFSVIAVDRAGNWGTVPANYGPIIVTEPYPVDLQPYTPTGWTAPLVLRSSEVPGSDPVTQPNLVHGHTVYFNLGYRNTAGGSSGSFRNVFHIDDTEVFVSDPVGLGGMAHGEQRNLGPLNLDLFGRRTVWARIDGQDDVPELNEDNNISARQFVFRPKPLASGQTVVRAGGLPRWNAGHELLPEYMTPYPNGDGFEIPLTVFPDLVWAVPDNPNDRLVMRFHQHGTGQDGFGEALVTTESAPNRPAVILNNYFESNLSQYCIGVSDQEGSGNTYRIHREVCNTFVMPDTLDGMLTESDCLDYYMLLNGFDHSRWFTVKLANPGIAPLRMDFFNPALAYGSLTSAVTTIWAAPFDTVHHTVLLEPNKRMLATVSRDPRFIGPSPYSISAYLAKSDLAATTPSGWFANLVPHVRRPYSPQGPVPAPTRLSGSPDSTAVYWSLSNVGHAPTPIGAYHRVMLNGELLFGQGIIEQIAPGQEVRGVNPAPGGGWFFHVPGGRKTLTHHINPHFDIDEDNFDNNVHGRQWVWEPPLLAMYQPHSLPVPPDPYGGLEHVTEGLVAQNCDGYRLSTHVSGSNNAIISVYLDGDGADVDVGFYSSADVQDGFTEALAQSTWSGDGCDFVLRAVGPGTHTSYVGLVRGFAFAGNPWGDVTLRSEETTFSWQNPLGSPLTNIAIEGGDFMHAFRLGALPPGDYLFTLQTEDAWPGATPCALGFSLHDMSDGYSSKTSPMQSAIAWQVPGSGDFGDVSFQVTIPDPAPSTMVLAVWRPDSVDPWDDAYYAIHVSIDYSGVEDAPTPAPVVLSSRIVSASPNPFNPSTTIRYEVARQGYHDLSIHDVSGRLVKTLVDGNVQPGLHVAHWNGLDNGGNRMSSGVYMARLSTDEGTAGLLKLMLIK